MNEQDPVPQHQRSHEARRAVALGILAFYAVTIVWAAVVAWVEQ